MNVTTETQEQGKGWVPRSGLPASSRRRRWLRTGWRLLPLAGIVYALVGLPFLLGGEPTAGPYREGERYPFGTELQAWYVTVGVDWIAFGLLFAAAALAAHQLPSRWLRAAVIASGALMWLPHLVIGVAFALDR